MTRSSPHLVVLSGMVTDLIVGVDLPVQAFQHQDARPMRFEAGSSANVMIAAARLGLRVSALGALGDDVPGAFLLQILRAEGIDTRAIQVIPGGQSPMTLALIDHQRGEHVFIGHVGEGQAAEYTQDIMAQIDAADALYWQGYVLHEKQVAALVDPALACAHARHIPIFFDVGPTVRSIPADRVRWALSQSSHLKMTEAELPLAAEGRTAQEAYDYLLGLGPQMLVITQGAQGSLIVDSEGCQHIAGFAVPVVDT